MRELPKAKLEKLAVKPAANMDYFNDYDRKRQAAGLTDAQVCAVAGVANSTVTRARHDHTTMAKRTYESLCTAITTLVTRRSTAMRRAGITARAA